MDLDEDEDEEYKLDESSDEIKKTKSNKKNKNKYKSKLRKKKINNIILDSGDEKEKEKDKNKNENQIIKSPNKDDIIPITKYSSLDPSLFSYEYISDYKCISCGLIPSFETAYETVCCGNLVCKECFQNYGDDNDECPKCSSVFYNLQTREIKKYNKIFYKSLKNLVIKCPYKCEWIGPWIDLESHLLKCDLSFRYCPYKFIGCDFVGENKKVKEHEDNNDKLHLDMAMKFIKDKNIIKKELKFEVGEACWTTCHMHPLIFTINREAAWICDGDKLEFGCENEHAINSRLKPRFRCDLCNFDLCESCIKKYFKNKFDL